MANINKIKLSGTTYNIQDLSAAKTVELTQAQYDALVSGGTVDPNTFYIITDAQGTDLSNYYTSAQTESAITAAVSGKVETSAVTSSMTSSSTDAQVPSAKCVYDQLGGLKLVKLTESEYTALVTKDSDTLYVVVPDPSN